MAPPKLPPLLPVKTEPVATRLVTPVAAASPVLMAPPLPVVELLSTKLLEAMVTCALPESAESSAPPQL